MSYRLKLLSAIVSVVLMGAFLVVAETTETTEARGTATQKSKKSKKSKKTSQNSNIFWHTSQPMSGNTGGASILVRGNKDVWLQGYAKGLNPMYAYTVWTVIFNHPEHCAGGLGACAGSDLATPEVEGSVIWGGGFIADGGDGSGDGSAQGHFELHLGKKNPLGPVLRGPALLNPRGAEIHFIIRCHGPALPDFAASQISTLHGGCDSDDPPGPNKCEDVQVGIHAP